MTGVGRIALQSGRLFTGPQRNKICKLPVTLLSDFLQTPLQLNRLVLEVRRDSLRLRPLKKGNLRSMKTSLSNNILVKIKTLSDSILTFGLKLRFPNDDDRLGCF